MNESTAYNVTKQYYKFSETVCLFKWSRAPEDITWENQLFVNWIYTTPYPFSAYRRKDGLIGKKSLFYSSLSCIILNHYHFVAQKSKIVYIPFELQGTNVAVGNEWISLQPEKWHGYFRRECINFLSQGIETRGKNADEARFSRCFFTRVPIFQVSSRWRRKSYFSYVFVLERLVNWKFKSSVHTRRRTPILEDGVDGKNGFHLIWKYYYET